MVDGTADPPILSKRAVAARKVLKVSSTVAIMGLLIGCTLPYVGFKYTEDTTVDVPSVKSAAGPSSSTKENAFRAPGQPFLFADSAPRVLIIGHIEVRRDGRPHETAGSLQFEANDYDSDVFTGLFPEKSEAVKYVSGNWFAGNIFAGKRILDRITIGHSFGYEFLGAYRGCGRRIMAGMRDWKFRLKIDEPSKAYYLGHIIFHEKPRDSFFVAGYIDIEVQDRADEFADSIRAMVGERIIEKALFPNCPK